ncbi:MAG TPA: sulfate adenylyltransferase subunit CysN [Candidatus Angelobacter sp.]|nr:sulfate adenylyltransferase subunit CysN [Candidatus Angelobacter sp.]
MAHAANPVEGGEFELFLKQNLSKDLLRFTTAGSVDDGKSTLIGRLLHDSKGIYEDQLASIRKSRINRSTGPIDFSLLTDGLRAEREQGITIDVGYRYFTTAKRKFIIADTPGHEQYTRNMATGASTADLAVILVDGTKGLLPQTLRHAYISSLLGIPSILAAINKMDLVDFSEERFLILEEEFTALAERLGVKNVQCIPVSALAGDNVVERSERTPWYSGPSLLEHLETVPVAAAPRTRAFRFPVQYVVRPDASFRGFAGRIASGVVRPGDVVTALPSGRQSRVESIATYDGQLGEAFAPMSVTLKLADEIDLSRGDMLAPQDNLPYVAKRFEATVVWMHAQPLAVGRNYLVKQTSRQVRGRVTRILHRVDIKSLQPEQAEELQMNDIATVEVETSSPLFFDSYRQNRTTGSFIIIDPLTNATLGAGMIQAPLSKNVDALPLSPELNLDTPVASRERYERHGHYPAIFSTARTALAKRLERALFDEGFEAIVVNANEGPLLAARDFWSALYAAGFMVIYANPSLGPEERAELEAGADGRYFDLDALSLPADDADAAQQVLALAEPLRIANERQE